MNTSYPILDLELLNLATAASLARNGILRALPAEALRNHPFHCAARLLRHISALEDALRDYDRDASPDEAWLATTETTR